MSTLATSKKILIVDDHKMIINGLKLLLRPRMYRIIEAYHLDTAIELAKAEKPDMAIVDFRLGNHTGDLLVREIRYYLPQTRILAYSYSSDETSLQLLLDAGVHGFLQKSEREEDILKAIDLLFAGNVYFDDLSRSYFMNRLQPTPEASKNVHIGDLTFTCKEIELIKLLSMELSAKEISQEIFLSERTVEQYKSKIAKKVGAKNMLGILKYAIRHGLLRAQDL